MGLLSSANKYNENWNKLHRIGQRGSMMRIFKIYEYKISRKDNLSEWFDKIQKVVEQYQFNEGHNWFCLEENFFQGVSAIDRLKKKDPNMIKYEMEAKEIHDPDLRRKKALTNCKDGFHELVNPNGVHESIDFPAIRNIAEKIPRSYPFHEALFIFDDIDWFQTGERREAAKLLDINFFPGVHQNLSSRIVFKSSWWVTGRQLTLNAAVEVPVSKSGNPEEIKLPDTIHSIGKIDRVSTVIIPDDLTYARLKKMQPKVDEIIKNYSSLEFDKMLEDKGVLPHSLPSQFDLAGELNTPFKKSLTAQFKPMGYSYGTFFHGIYTFVKRTKSDHQITLAFDTGRMKEALSCTMVIESPFWKHRLDLPSAVGKEQVHFSRGHFPIPDEGMKEKVIANFKAAAAYLEETFVPEIESLYEPAPEWFVYTKDSF